MLSKKDRHKHKRYIKLVSKQYQLENELKNINEKLSKCKPEIFSCKIQDGFVKVREKYFSKLQYEVAENLKCCSSVVNAETIESLSLIVEQNALLASIQQSAYQRVVSEIIKDVRNATKRNSLYPLISINLGLSVKPTETMSTDIKKIPIYPETKETNETIPWKKEKIFEEEEDIFIPYEPEDEEMEPNDPEIDPDLADFIINFEGVDDELNQLVPQSNRHQQDQYDIENLIGILEGSETTKTDPDAETDEEKLQKVRELLIRNNKNQQENKKIYPRFTPLEMWKNERYIYMYKVVQKCSQMNSYKFHRTRKIFSKFFGDDSDYEHEEEFTDREKFLLCCSRRILPIVAEYMTPFQQQIQNADIFKQLAQRIANSLINITDTPSHVQIRQFVERFFINGKKFIDLSDVWLYEID